MVNLLKICVISLIMAGFCSVVQAMQDPDMKDCFIDSVQTSVTLGSRAVATYPVMTLVEVFGEEFSNYHANPRHTIDYLDNPAAMSYLVAENNLCSSGSGTGKIVAISIFDDFEKEKRVGFYAGLLPTILDNPPAGNYSLILDILIQERAILCESRYEQEQSEDDSLVSLTEDNNVVVSPKTIKRGRAWSASETQAKAKPQC